MTQDFGQAAALDQDELLFSRLRESIIRHVWDLIEPVQGYSSGWFTFDQAERVAEEVLKELRHAPTNDLDEG